ncbi:MAG: Na+/H+ antiporter subunit E [Solirubrobacterales bacterium]
MSYAIATVLLAAVYLLTLGSAGPWDIAFGLVLAAGLLAALGRASPSPGEHADRPGALRRAAATPWFALGIVGEVVAGTWQVGLISAGLRPLRGPGIVEVPFGERSATGVAVTGLAATLSPGAVLIDVDWDRRTFLLHVLDASDPDAVRADQQRFYERYQRGAFP